MVKVVSLIVLFVVNCEYVSIGCKYCQGGSNETRSSAGAGGKK